MDTPLIPCLVASFPLQTAPNLIQAFLGGRSPSTMRAYASDLEDFRAFLLLPSLDEAARHLLGNGNGHANGVVMAYRASLVERGLSSATIARRLSAVRCLVRLARTLGIIGWTLGVDAPKVENYRDTRGPGQDGTGAILRAAQASLDPMKAARDRALILMLFAMALRRAETTELRLEDFNAPEGCLWVMAKGKTQRERVTIPAPVLEALKAWIALRGPEAGPLFISLDRATHGHALTVDGLYAIVKALGRLAGLNVRPHGLRHAGITVALDITGGDVRKVQRFSRHKDVRTLQRYDDNRQDLGGLVASMVAAQVA